MTKRVKKTILITMLAAACIALAVTNYRHYFTPQRWSQQPGYRHKLVDSLEFQHRVYALHQGEILTLLGEPDGNFVGGIYYELGNPGTWMDFLIPEIQADIHYNNDGSYYYSAKSESSLQYYIYLNDQDVATRTRVSTQG